MCFFMLPPFAPASNNPVSPARQHFLQQLAALSIKPAVRDPYVRRAEDWTKARGNRSAGATSAFFNTHDLPPRHQTPGRRRPEHARSPLTHENQHSRIHSAILSWHALPSRLNRIVERATGFLTHPGGIFPYYAARCIIRTNAAHGSTKLLAPENQRRTRAVSVC